MREKFEKVLGEYAFTHATIEKVAIAKTEEQPILLKTAAEGVKTRERSVKKKAQGTEEASSAHVIREIEEGKKAKDAKPTMVLFFDPGADYSKLLLSTFNSYLGAELAKKLFRLVRVDFAELKKTPGLAKRYGVSEPILAFYTPSGRLYGTLGETNVSGQAFLGFLEDMSLKAAKIARAEAKQKKDLEARKAREDKAKRRPTPDS